MASSRDVHYRVQASPKVSANQLAAYLVATDVAREGIIRAAHYQRKIQVIQYKEVRQAAARFLSSPVRDGRILEGAKQSLQDIIDSSTAKPAAKDHARRSIAAIEAFQSGLNSFGLAGMTFKLPPHNQPPLMIEGVEVNVTLDALVEAVKRPGENLTGGVILQPGKGIDGDSEEANSKRRRIGTAAATLIHMAVSSRRDGDGEPSRRHCLSIDVQRREAHPCPANTIARILNINAACRQIAALWDRIAPPPDYRG